MGKSYSNKQSHNVVDYRNSKFLKKRLKKNKKNQSKLEKHVDIDSEDYILMNNLSGSFNSLKN